MVGVVVVVALVVDVVVTFVVVAVDVRENTYYILCIII